MNKQVDVETVLDLLNKWKDKVRIVFVKGQDSTWNIYFNLKDDGATVEAFSNLDKSQVKTIKDNLKNYNVEVKTKL